MSTYSSPVPGTETGPASRAVGRGGRVLLVHGLQAGPGTWWRVGPALEARGWEVERAVLAGHGGRPLGGVRTVADLADDVAARHPDGATLVVGHSLGAVVALQLVTRPSYAAGALLEDPPGPGGPGRGRAGTAERSRDDAAARADPHAAVSELLHGHPTWTRRDARSVVEGKLRTDPALSLVPSRELSWDLPALVEGSPVPVGVVVAVGRHSALGEPDRARLLAGVPPELVTQVSAGHHVHLDEPDRWVEAVDAFGRRLVPGDPPR